MTSSEFAYGGRPPLAPLLVGRVQEQALLREQLNGAMAGIGGLVLIGGEAGIGKSALAEALESDALARGALVFVGHCFDLIETPPYGPWTELLDHCAPLSELPPRSTLLGEVNPDGAPESQAARFAGVRDFLLATAVQPIVLVIEDLHWADPASLDLLRFLARELAGTALLLLVTYRTEELHRQHPLYALLPTLVREAHAVRLDLRPLSDDDLRALVRSRHALTAWDEARLVTYLHERAGGNPFFAGELLRALGEEGMLRPATADDGSTVWRLGDLSAVRVPPFLRQVIDGRLARLGENAYRILGLAATIGHEAPLGLWRTVVDSSDEMLADVVERAVAAHLLVETADGQGVRFAHALIREALYEGVPLPRRQDWHRRIGEALLSFPTPDPDAIASHFRLADDARAADWMIQAGERAQRSYAWATAIERFSAGLALLEAQNADRTQRAWLHLRLGLLLRYTDPPRALAALEIAQLVCAGTDDALLVAAATCYAGHLRCWSDDVSDGVIQMAEGVAALDALPPADRARFARLLAEGTTGVLTDNAIPQAILAQWLAIVGRYAEARQAAEAILATEPDGDPIRGVSPESFYDAYHALGYVNAAEGRPNEARRYWRRSQTSLRAIGHHAALHQQLYVELSAAVLPYQTDHLPERARLAEEVDAARRGARGIWREEDEPACLALWFIEGRWADIRGVVSVPESFRLLDVSENPAIANLARAQGDVTLAWRLVRNELPQGPETLPGTARRFLSGMHMLRLGANLSLDANDPDVAYHWLETHDRWLAWSGAVLGQAEGHLTWAAFHLATGDLDMARRSAEQSLAGATTPRQPLVLLDAHRFLGELDTTVGRYVEAEHHLAQSLALAGACAAPYERAQTLLGFAELRAAAGKCDAARAPLIEARARFNDLDARPMLARADALALTLDETAAATIPPAELAGLSAREIEVLRLVARGLSNSQVAEHLSLSPRTINSHLTTIYSKLGVTSRGFAIRFALDHNIR